MCTCNACGNKINPSEAFVSPSGKYYCSKEHYEDCRAMWRIVYKFVDDSPLLREERLLWGNNCRKVVYFLSDNDERIEQAMSKDFTSLRAKTKYFSAIIKNGIVDYIEPPPDIIKKADNEIYESKYKPKRRRKCLSEYVMEADTI